MGIPNFEELIDKGKNMFPQRLAIAASGDKKVLEAVKSVKEYGIQIQFNLVGDEKSITQAAEEIDLDLKDNDIHIHRAKCNKEAAVTAVKLVSEGKADFLMKGMVSTRDLLKTVLQEDYGLRTGHILSHVGAFQVSSIDRLLFITDGGINLAPDLESKKMILENAISLVRNLGVDTPKAAILAAVENVNPNMEVTLDASYLAKMNDRGQLNGALVDGPLALDNAISEEARQQKGISGPVAGQADILLVPDIESGNLLGKSLTFLAEGTMAGLVVGAKVPIVLTSRADSNKSKMISMILGALAGHNL